MLTKNQVFDFIKSNYGDIESFPPLSNMAGQPPPKEWLIRPSQLKKIMKKSEEIDPLFGERIEFSFAKTTIDNKPYHWLDFPDLDSVFQDYFQFCKTKFRKKNHFRQTKNGNWELVLKNGKILSGENLSAYCRKHGIEDVGSF